MTNPEHDSIRWTFRAETPVGIYTATLHDKVEEDPIRLEGLSYGVYWLSTFDEVKTLVEEDVIRRRAMNV